MFKKEKCAGLGQCEFFIFVPNFLFGIYKNCTKARKKRSKKGVCIVRVYVRKVITQRFVYLLETLGYYKLILYNGLMCEYEFVKKLLSKR